jgi:alkylation response protein AidB-like acyl-CoA dehydrogenase
MRGATVVYLTGRDLLMRFARERGAHRDPTIRQALADVYLGVETFRHTCQRTLDKLLRMGMPGPEASIIKLHWTELTQSMPRVGMSILGPAAQFYDIPTRHPRASVDQCSAVSWRQPHARHLRNHEGHRRCSVGRANDVTSVVTVPAPPAMGRSKA